MNPATPSQSSNKHAPPADQESSRSSQRRSIKAGSLAHARPAPWHLVEATPADHAAIGRFLVSVTQQPTVAEFQAQQDNPFYEPADRLLVKSGNQIISHLRLAHREMHFGPVVLPVAMVEDLATQPEYRCRGFASALLAEAAGQMERSGAVLGLLRTHVPRFYADRGWVVCGRHSYAAAAPRTILSHLRARHAEQQQGVELVLRRPRPRDYTIRLWRHVEQAALARLFDPPETLRWGTILRSDSYWRWLIGRRGYDRIYVAIDGQTKFALDDQVASIVGYAVVKQGRIVELTSSADHPDAVHQLLARACGDAIEQDVHRIQLDAPPHHSMHRIFTEAGGSSHLHEADRGEVFMARLVKPRRVLKALRGTLYARARDAGLPSVCELGIMLDNSRLRLRVSRHGARLLSGKLGRSYLQCTAYQLTQLLLGHLNLEEAIEKCRIRASTRVAHQTASALFPAVPWWFPPWDSLPAP